MSDSNTEQRPDELTPEEKADLRSQIEKASAYFKKRLEQEDTLRGNSTSAGQEEEK